MVRENKGSTVKEELEIILEDEDSDLGFPVSSPDGNEMRAFSYNKRFFENYISASSLYDSRYQDGKTRKN